MFMRSAAIAALTLIPALGACTTNWTEYPWADTGDMCTGEIIGAGVHRTLPPIPSANGTVVAVSGEPLPEGLHYRISFSSDHGAQTMTTRSPAFSLCIENPERKSDYQWLPRSEKARRVQSYFDLRLLSPSKPPHPSWFWWMPFQISE